MSNVIGCLRILGGTDAAKVRFSWPSGHDDDVFLRQHDFRQSLERMALPDNILAEDISPVTAAEVMAQYEGARRRRLDDANEAGAADS